MHPSAQNILGTRHELPVSGTWATPSSPGRAFISLAFETIRLDVDGVFPQMMGSGSYAASIRSLSSPAYWIASDLAESSPGVWSGSILKKWGNASLIPFTSVEFHISRAQMFAYRPRMTVVFATGNGTAAREFEFISPWFREVTFEFDTVQDASRVTSVNTCAHNQRPKFLPCEILTFDTVFDRAGVQVTQSPHRSTVPISTAGGDAAWSDAELDGAMHKFFSTYADAPDWAVWTLFATKHVVASRLGTMFDDSGTNQRQGCAVFNDSLSEYVQQTSASDPQFNEHLARMKFFDLVHEVGHCFNLHHAWLYWDAALEWPFFTNTKDVPTFMNYPECVLDYWGRCEYRFDDSELKFLRHAPDNFVEMGDAPFYGGSETFYEPAAPGAILPWELELSLPHPRAVFEFLEPVTVTVSLRNTSGRPRTVDGAILQAAGSVAVVIGGSGRASRFLRPFAHACFLPDPRVLQPGESLSTTFFAGAGVDGWYFAEPGAYKIQAVLRTHGAVYTTAVLPLRVAHPSGWDEEVLAQDFFTGGIARALAFGATPARPAAMETLREVVDRFPGRAVARHAAVALAQTHRSGHRVLRDTGGAERGFDLVPADHDTARKLVQRAVFDDPDAAAASFGRHRSRALAERFREYAPTRRDRNSS